MELKQLRSFVEVVRHESFTKAAEKLFISQPTISAHIRALEEELGRRLIVRTTKSLEITPKGREVFDYALHMLELQQRMMCCCEKEMRTIIHLGASTVPATYILPQLLPKFGRLHPEIYFVIHQSDSGGVADGLRAGVLDLGLIGEKDEENLICEPFCRDKMVLITPVNEQFLSLREAQEPPLEQLLSQPIILREQGTGSRKSAERFLEKLGVAEEQLNVTARVNDQETVKNLVAGGLGVSIVSERAARSFVEEKRVLQFELPAHEGRSLYLAYRKDHVLPGHVREFFQFVKRDGM